ncbi:hypothetical protein FQA39_LY12687 [Lamprigera yunnana]|nr:hypothetical protein FQA39_LY12687 [Lamprigera yunnana]
MNTFIYPALTAAFAAFVTYSGYCVYKQTHEKFESKCSYNIFESRLTEMLHEEANKSDSYHQLCENTVGSAIQRRDFFMKKIQAANVCMKLGDYALSVDYLIQAMAACSKPGALLQCMSKTLPSSVYKMLIKKLSSLS